ncbi:MAG: serine/threonine-protein kinase [Bacteroidota bacterium]
MTPERWQQVEALFDAVLGVAEQDRAALLADAEPTVRAEVERLLAAHDAEDDGFLAPVARLGDLDLQEMADAAFVQDEDGDDLIGTTVGSYRLVQRLGRGGMGTVYAAERADGAFRQRVALKLIRRGLDTDDLVQRFRAERQILASLSHKNIARLLDGGSTGSGSDGRTARPFLAMEYVEGEPITAFCDRQRFGVEARLRLFLDVCAAVQHAHQHLVVHRDLKPSNILVASDAGNAPAVKLLDFGVAKLLNPGLSEYAGLVTHHAARLLTPAYASPEQLRGQPITTASDLYSLGVLLAELLTGARPYDLTHAAPAEIERIVCETTPAPPSQQVTTGEAPGLLGIEAGTLAKRLRGDLDMIVGMAMRKEPSRRYASVEQFADDLRRHLDGLPVRARPDEIGYRVRKFVGRHRAAVAAASLVAVLLVAFSLVTAFQARQVAEQARIAERERDKAAEVSAFLLDLFAQANPALTRGDTLTAQALLDRGAARLTRTLADQPLVQADLLDVMSTAYERMGQYAAAEAQARSALALRVRNVGEADTSVARSRRRVAETVHWQGRYEEADTLYQAALLALEPGGGPQLAEAQTSYGALRADLGDEEESERLYRQALTVLSPTEGTRAARARTLNNLSILLRRQGRADEAFEAQSEALRLRRAALGDDHPDVAQSLTGLAILHYGRGAADESTRLFHEALDVSRAAYGPDHPQVASMLINLGGLYLRLGTPEQAEAPYREALAIREAALGQRHADVAQPLEGLADSFEERGMLGEAERHQRRALAIRREALGMRHPRMALSLLLLADIVKGQGRGADGAALQREALSIRADAFGETDGRTAYAQLLLAETLAETGDAVQARTLATASLRVFQATGDADSTRAAGLLAALNP